MKYKAPIKLLITILPRGQGDRLTGYFAECGAKLQYILYGHGTARSDIVDYLGFDEPEKDVLLGFVPAANIAMLHEKIDDEIRFSRHGTGISFSLGLSAVSRGLANKVELDSISITKKEEDEELATKEQFEMIACVMERDLCDIAMTAAKNAGARGGTVMKGREVTSEETKKVFGFTIQPEKDLLLLIVKSDIKQDVMSALCAAIAAESDERAVVFSMPVDDVVGINKNNN